MLKKSTAKVHIFRELRNTLRQKLLPQGIISGAIFEGRHGAKGAWERAAEGAAHNFRGGCALYNNVWRAYVSHPL